MRAVTRNGGYLPIHDTPQSATDAPSPLSGVTARSTRSACPTSTVFGVLLDERRGGRFTLSTVAPRRN
jgi:hypothetical protein